MFIKKVIVLFTVLMILSLGNVVFAAKCKNIVGEWDFTHTSVSWDGNFEYQEPTNGVITIEDQNGCLFYGTMGDKYFTGAINGNTIIVTIHDTTVYGTLKGKTITFMMSEVTGPSEDACASHILTAKKR